MGKENGIISFSGMWIELEIIMLSETAKLKRQILYVLLHLMMTTVRIILTM
jgi:hypothetical protein